jgi:hypothetical protein
MSNIFMVVAGAGFILLGAFSRDIFMTVMGWTMFFMGFVFTESGESL